MKKMILLFLLMPSFIFSQGWEKTYANGEGYSIIKIIDNNYVITGVTYDSCSSIYLAKVDLSGDLIWEKTIGEHLYNYGYSVIETIDNGYVVTGYSREYLYGDQELLVAKTNQDGDLLWEKHYTGEYNASGQEIIQANDGGFLIVGLTNLYKLNESGDLIWAKTIFDDVYNVLWSICQSNDDSYIIAGKIQNPGSADVVLLKINESGDTLWTKTYGNEYHDMVFSVNQVDDGGFILTGYSYFINGSSYDVYLIRTDINGNLLWEKYYDNDEIDYGNSVIQTTDGGYLIVGFTGTQFTDFDIYLIKTNEFGDTLWTKTYGNQFDDMGTSVQLDFDGGYILTGYTMDSDTNRNICLIKIDSEGNITSTSEIPLPNSNRKLIKTLDFQGREIQPKENIPYIEVYDDGSTEKKVIVK